MKVYLLLNLVDNELVESMETKHNIEKDLFHVSIWKKLLNEGDIDYRYYPRGRFYLTRNEYNRLISIELTIPKSLNKDFIINKLLDTLGLKLGISSNISIILDIMEDEYPGDNYYFMLK
jgi:hypothetical protein